MGGSCQQRGRSGESQPMNRQPKPAVTGKDRDRQRKPYGDGGEDNAADFAGYVHTLLPGRYGADGTRPLKRAPSGRGGELRLVPRVESRWVHLPTLQPLRWCAFAEDRFRERKKMLMPRCTAGKWASQGKILRSCNARRSLDTFRRDGWLRAYTSAQDHLENSTFSSSRRAGSERLLSGYVTGCSTRLDAVESRPRLFSGCHALEPGIASPATFIAIIRPCI